MRNRQIDKCTWAAASEEFALTRAAGRDMVCSLFSVCRNPLARVFSVSGLLKSGFKLPAAAGASSLAPAASCAPPAAAAASGESGACSGAVKPAEAHLHVVSTFGLYRTCKTFAACTAAMSP